MADLAKSRVRIIDNSRKRSDGKRIHEDTGWEIVDYGSTIFSGELLCPVDSMVELVQANVDKEITGYLFTESIGIPDAYRGETVMAFVVVKPGEPLTVKEVTDYCREHLAAYKIPRKVEFVDTLPKSAVGKILRRELRNRELKKMKPDV